MSSGVVKIARMLLDRARRAAIHWHLHLGVAGGHFLHPGPPGSVVFPLYGYLLMLGERSYSQLLPFESPTMAILFDWSALFAVVLDRKKSS